jgi:hypothetical protein
MKLEIKWVKWFIPVTELGNDGSSFFWWCWNFTRRDKESIAMSLFEQLVN